MRMYLTSQPHCFMQIKKLGMLQKTIKLKVNGSIVDDQEQIEGFVVAFFNALFNGHHNADLEDTGVSNLNTYLDGLYTLPDDVRDGLTSCITLDDIRQVVLGSANNKSPGLDGITYEF